ncbi:MAG: PilT/PilU family type 4a pilus ATPase, partial [Endomicrobiia bacterium]|nr:PilT/PilU family type 4a pilus ATPase [Endomicrobiia bacterium]
RSNSAPALRVDGIITKIESVALNETAVEQMACEILDDRNEQILKNRFQCDTAISLEDGSRFRLNVYKQRGTLNIAVRSIPGTVPTLADIKLPAAVAKIAENRRGLVLVTGNTGCGKSTTLAAMINHINENRAAHIITVEDPIEFIHKDKKSIVTQREIGLDTANYADALKHVVREDPDVILIGEMRDIETMATALTAAQTGHLVLSTVHTIDAIQTITRIVDMFAPHQQNQIRLQLSDTLKAVISQRLSPHASGKGRLPVSEILVVTGLVKKFIAENNIAEIISAMKQGQYYGMQSFNQSLLALIKSKEINLQDALEIATNPEELMLSIRGIESSIDSATDILERF